MSKKERRKKLAKKTVIAYKKARKGKKSCALCKKKLAGTLTMKKERKASKTERRPSRIFSGVLCANCCKEIVSEAVKIKLGIKSLEDMELSRKNYIENTLARMGKD